jgi:hypothetical protein
MKTRLLIPLVVVALTGVLPHSKAGFTLGAAGSFAVLGGATVTSTGNTVVNGDLGVSPGSAISGFPPGIVNGTIQPGDAAAAHTDAVTAYNYLAGEPVNQNLTGTDLGGRTLSAGVYKFDSSAALTGTLTLNGPGVFVFQIGSTLTSATISSVLLENGAQAGNVFWQVGSSATLAGTSFDGTILADASIGLTSDGASINGRALALTGAVTLDDNSITVPTVVPVPEPASFWSGAFIASFVGIWQCLALWRRKAGRS